MNFLSQLLQTSFLLAVTQHKLFYCCYVQLVAGSERNVLPCVHNLLLSCDCPVLQRPEVCSDFLKTLCVCVITDLMWSEIISNFCTTTLVLIFKYRTIASCNIYAYIECLRIMLPQHRNLYCIVLCCVISKYMSLSFSLHFSKECDLTVCLYAALFTYNTDFCNAVTLFWDICMYDIYVYEILCV